MNRKRPPENCDDPEFWLAETVNDATRDAINVGMLDRDAVFILVSLAMSYARSANLDRSEIDRIIAANRGTR